MATSGVEVHEDAKTIMNDVKLRKQRYAIFKISDDNKCIEVVKLDDSQEEILVNLKESPVDSEKKTQKALELLHAKLNDNPSEPRYMYFNYVCDKGGRVLDKNILFHYNPDNGKIKHKMLYSSSKDALKKVTPASFVDLHITEAGDLIDFKELKTQIISKSGST
ncbi:hypothetical protein LOD99_14922 [Oopsacas minuta]|uniref:ADF-H domain-containing protein n=1 Tax=Oopsacas minuta TaxID=111878 RepID=A0AAV7KDR1_9METZ|nr:hypothetical protein LOD99_14922 [Oopsacas minuta]